MSRSIGPFIIYGLRRAEDEAPPAAMATGAGEEEAALTATPPSAAGTGGAEGEDDTEAVDDEADATAAVDADDDDVCFNSAKVGRCQIKMDPSSPTLTMVC